MARLHFYFPWKLKVFLASADVHVSIHWIGKSRSTSYWFHHILYASSVELCLTWEFYHFPGNDVDSTLIKMLIGFTLMVGNTLDEMEMEMKQIMPFWMVGLAIIFFFCIRSSSLSASAFWECILLLISLLHNLCLKRDKSWSFLFAILFSLLIEMKTKVKFTIHAQLYWEHYFGFLCRVRYDLPEQELCSCRPMGEDLVSVADSSTNDDEDLCGFCKKDGDLLWVKHCYFALSWHTLMIW